ncbi:hypothetical protein Pcinc_032727 [Petrolisthes cinctipes]|uniref:WD repeat-containing protein 76 n=1 Tax=Petrolisthes cinctipes TaxID=88211 RepID=A0AAE1K074_PETCI|nr:hypothetical protein Pcinc_032727 [Petrolisthes cinctipes]
MKFSVISLRTISKKSIDVKKELDACRPCPVKKRINHEKPFALEQLEEHPRSSPGPAAVTDYCRDQDKEACWGLLQELQGIVVKGANKKTPWTCNVNSVVKQMKKMVVREEYVAKVVPNRTFSNQIHPTMTKTLVLVGAKWGELGVWDVDRKDESNRAHFFNPHIRPINCLTVDPTSPNHIYTTSYDGSVRTDLEAGIIQQVYSYLPKNDHSQWVSWHTHVDQHTLLVAASHGKIIKLDLRQDSKKPSSMFQVHNYNNVKVVTQHPMNSSYFASTGRDGKVCLWDVRKMRPNSPVSEWAQRKQISVLEFSPVTCNTLISTCADDYLRFISCDLSSLTVSREIKHDNHTGRWLTTFKARFVPHQDDLIIVGSMRQPHKVK